MFASATNAILQLRISGGHLPAAAGAAGGDGGPHGGHAAEARPAGRRRRDAALLHQPGRAAIRGRLRPVHLRPQVLLTRKCKALGPGNRQEG